MHEDRRPGWYPDPRVGGRFRLWDDEGWHGVTSSEPVWGKVSPTRSGASRPRWTGGRLLIAAVAVVAVVVLAWLIGSRSSNGAGDTSSTRPGSSEAAAGRDVDPDRAGADGADADGAADGSADGSSGTGAASESDRGAGARDGNGGGDAGGAPSGTGPGSAGPDDPEGGGVDDPDDGATPGPTDSIPLVSVPPESSCAITDAEFSAVLDTPEIRRVVGDERFGDVRCINNLVAARTSSGLIAVVRQDPSGWTLATLGDDSPCLELELPADITSALGC